MSDKPKRHMKLDIMPDDGRWAWWEEYVTDDPIEVKVTKHGYKLKYTVYTGERRTTDCILFKLEGKSLEK